MQDPALIRVQAAHTIVRNWREYQSRDKRGRYNDGNYKEEVATSHAVWNAMNPDESCGELYQGQGQQIVVT